MPNFEEKALKEKISILKDSDQTSKKWSEGLMIKSLILLPIVIYSIGFYFLNRASSLFEIITSLTFAIIFVVTGVLLLSLMTNYKR